MAGDALWFVKCTKYFRATNESGIETFDDILIYIQSEEDHKGHLRQVLTTLQANKFFVNMKRCSL